MNFPPSDLENIPATDPLGRLTAMVRLLRSENGCPWDRKQNARTLVVCLIEEVFELAAAVESGDPTAVREELGDVLFQIAFLSELFLETHGFGGPEAATEVLAKMVRRHPHVFGDVVADSAETVLVNWDRIKQTEKRADADPAQSRLHSIPKGLPALLRAYRVSERAARTGFDWSDLQGVMEKTEEEWQEFKEALTDCDIAAKTLEFGDLLFTLTNVARFAGIHPETALTAAVEKFSARFQYLESHAAAAGQPLETVPFAEKQALWDRAKKTIP